MLIGTACAIAVSAALSATVLRLYQQESPGANGVVVAFFLTSICFHYIYDVILRRSSQIRSSVSLTRGVFRLKGLAIVGLTLLAGAFCYWRLIPPTTRVEAFVTLAFSFILAGGLVQSVKLIRRYE